MKLNADLSRWLSAALVVFTSMLPGVGLAQTPVIAEFVALNNTGLADEDGERFDWLELHNPAGSALNLGGYYLTDKADNLTKWEVPAGVNLEAGGTLVVWASEKNRRDPAANLHTNFKLSASGEFLALVAPDGLTVVHGFGDAFPEQMEDVSYGLLSSSNVGSVGFFDPPTPGSVNPGTFANFVGEVAFSKGGGVFFDAFDLVLSGAKPGETIRYNLQDDWQPQPQPTTASTAYTGPIRIDATVQIRARVFGPDGTPGETVSHTFIAGDESAPRYTGATFKEFTSHLPIMVLTDFGMGRPVENVVAPDRRTRFPDGPPMHWFIYEPKEATGGRSSVLNEPDMESRGRMKVRGSSTAGNAKFSLSVEAWDEADEDKDVPVLGLPQESDWILSARYRFDRALVRNPLMYELSNQIGRYAVRTRFVEVFVDTNGGTTGDREYMGVYSLMEKIKRGGDRVDVAGLSPAQTEAPEVSGGYLFKNDRRDPGDNGFNIRVGRVSPMSSLSFMDPKEDEIVRVPAQRNYLINEMTDAGEALFAADGISPDTGRHFSEIIDVPAWLDHHWLNTLAMNVDGFRLSGYFHKDRNGPIVAGPIWDFDRTMESDDGRDNDPLTWDGPPDSSRTWFDNRYQLWGWLLGYQRQLSLSRGRPISFYESTRPDVFQQHTDRWFELRQGAFSTENIHSLIDSMTGEIGEAQGRNFRRWRENSPRRSNNSRVRELDGTYQGEVNQLKEWLKQRAEWIDVQYPQIPSFSVDGGQVDSGFELDATAAAGSILLTTDGSDPRLPGGAPAAGTHVMGEPVVTSGTEVVVGENAGCVYLVPEDSSVDDVWHDVDFIDASWTAATNGLGWDSGAQADGSGLWAAVTTDIRDQVQGVSTSVYVRYTFNFDKGAGRNVTGGLLRAKFDDGYIAYLNGVKIAERNPPAAGSPSHESAASTTNSDSVAVVWANATLIDEEAFKAAVRDGKNVLAVHMLNASVSSDILFRGELSLDVDTQQSDPEPLKLTESALVTARTKDGWMWSAPKQAYFVVGEERASASNLVISEVMYHPAPATAAEIAAGFDDADDFEFIEVLNPSDKAVNLYELAFTDGVGFDFSDGDVTSLGPGERGIIVRKRRAFETRYGPGLPVIGKFGGDRLNNAGETVTLVGAGGATVHAFTYSDSAPWPAGADGTGVSMVLKAPGTLPDHSLPESWEAGGYAGGTPGFPDSAYHAWKAANGVKTDFGDGDGDGTFELAEFILGTGADDPASGLATNGPVAGLTELGGVQVPTVSVVVSDAAVAAGAVLLPEVSADLDVWREGEGLVNLVGEVSNGDGTTTRVYRVDESVGAGEWYVRFVMGIR